MRMLSDYVLAASHLYGVVSLHDFELLLRYYEKNLDDFDGYAREEGSYKNHHPFPAKILRALYLTAADRKYSTRSTDYHGRPVFTSLLLQKISRKNRRKW
mgnify:CR=1 FL=1